ncbi:translation initiation factor eIF-2B subunit delta isoform X2 [Athalia rosae]|uniref:translation initiation factor eIF-2B subunit delta isoform X2 n=1 Tax=Athalia rosae TaxID=37344 RepID=UPI00203398D7|nr:translation initiation factor eIF-2B subunit delta isoform X2 [Athalia rosae]
MDQQTTEVERPRISRSKARHLRHKRLKAARRSENNPPLQLQSDEKQRVASVQETDDTLSKSKARRLRRKKKSEEVKNSNRTTEKPVALSDDELPSKSTNLRKPVENPVPVINSESGIPPDHSHGERSIDLIKEYPSQSTYDSDKTVKVIKNSNDSVNNRTVKDIEDNSISDKPIVKMNPTEKTREQIKAEREAKKTAKALAKNKAKVPKSEQEKDTKSSTDLPVEKANPERLQKDSIENVAAEKVEKPAGKQTASIAFEKTSVVDNKENEPQIKVDGKSKKESKAERRAKQESQRAAKEKLALEKNKPKLGMPAKAKAPPPPSDSAENIVRKTLVNDNLHEVKLFKHLYHERKLCLRKVLALDSNIHPAIVRLGVQYEKKVIVGSNARCVALLAAVKQMLQDFECPPQADFTRIFESSLFSCEAYLNHCRPLAVSMQNALKHLKWQMTQLPTTVSDEDAKSKLSDAIDTYIREQIQLAGKAISNTIQTKISNGDVILTYAFSSLIHNILIDAHKAGKQFRVIVVDGRPWLEGKELLRRLANHGIECSYILINALSFIMPEVSKVFLGAHAILANGAVMSRAGTSQVALMAKTFNVPVLVACETHKSCERVQTDSFVYNEIGDANELTRQFLSKTKKSPLLNWKTKKYLDLLNITFDVTPANLVSAVVTELAILPCTSIPVILRIKPSEI